MMVVGGGADDSKRYRHHIVYEWMSRLVQSHIFFILFYELTQWRKVMATAAAAVVVTGAEVKAVIIGTNEW